MSDCEPYPGQPVAFDTYSFDGRAVHLTNAAIGHDSLWTANDEEILRTTVIGPDTVEVITRFDRYLISYRAYQVLCGDQPVSILSEPIDLTPDTGPLPTEWKQSKPPYQIWSWLFWAGIVLITGTALASGWYVGGTGRIIAGFAMAGLTMIIGLCMVAGAAIAIDSWRTKRMLKRRCPTCGRQNWEVIYSPTYRCWSCRTICDLKDGRYRTLAMQNQDLREAWNAVFVTPYRRWTDIEQSTDLAHRED